MNKAIILFLCIVMTGCYTTMTSVFSSYDLKPRERVERQPDYLFEASPHLALGNSLLAKFIRVPGRSLKPNPETCEQSLEDRIDMLLYSDQNYVVDLSQVVIRGDDRKYRVKSYQRYPTKSDVVVQSNPFVQVGFMSSGFSQFKETVNLNFREAYRRFVADKEIIAGTSLQFDGKFSCGENSYEMDLWFIHKDSGKQEKYTIYFFPWKSSLTPH
ncbi:MAG: hypothetical protein KJ556_11870 [Gammaproteobacteria bacterium]|nr:hypothetical protein [Gammaproteobacteria bacterium]MBU2059928.1 hypothetical protein [Gammaproteobacteria bacterium]MBU2175817.1 hypothetical protein [Gammaproteobacteria bacterium]MBU2247640.1 hypothetical protein [Gammaproteobacteria bacterium]MBU2342955.1 hypothetical protein [Gammaproteobacteria bacterium]